MFLGGCAAHRLSPIEAAKAKNSADMERALSVLGPLKYTATTLQSQQDAAACAARDESREAREYHCRPYMIRAEINARKDEYDHAMKVQRIEQKYALMNMNLDVQKTMATPATAAVGDTPGGDWNYSGHPGGLGTRTPAEPSPVPARLETVNHEQLEIGQASGWNRLLRFFKNQAGQQP